MIGLLRGRVVRHGPSDLILDVGGVGYRIVASPVTVAAVASSADEVEVSIHTHVRDDAIILYGFANDAEREVFEILLSTHGVGPSLALAILGTLGASGVVVAVQTGEASAFESVTGVGKKTAARLVLELQDSLSSRALAEEFDGATTSGASRDRSDVSAALGELGYSPEEIREATSVLDGTETVEHGLRIALRQLSRP
jgi:Holliday junction DNA helicase RuvA